MLQHQKDAAVQLIENKNYLCPATNTNGNGFIWVEDDAIPCLNFLELLNVIFDLFQFSWEKHSLFEVGLCSNIVHVQ